MLKRISLSFLLVIFATIGFAQLNINLIANYPFPINRGEVIDIWGYVDELNNEYAIVGLEKGVAVVDISTPSVPVEVFYTPGPNNGWRDIKVWKDVAYITNEGTGGLMLIDMTKLPGGTIVAGDVSSYGGVTYPFTKAHNMYIDENGIGYILGADNGIGGAIILDLDTDPLNPIELGRYDDYYVHDAMVRGDTLWGGCINDGFFVAVDVSNKANPTTMVTHNTPGLYAHNCWVSDDGQYLFTTDEKSNAFIGAFDVSDFANITEIDRIQSSPGENVIPHNAFYLNGYVITSYYRDGVTIHDVNNPSNMVEVGNYDTSPAFSGNGFNGCWGVYPYLPSGLIIASDIENGLFVLGPTYVRGAYLEGNVIDSVTTANLDGVQVTIDTTNVMANTNVLGDYKTGIGIIGTYDITYTKYAYETKTVTNVNLVAASTTTVDVELVPLPTFNFQGKVVEALTANPIANATVQITGNLFSTTLQTDTSGDFSIANLLEGKYNIYIAKWGHGSLCLDSVFLSGATNPYQYQLDKKYYDDFTFDLGWSVSGSATVGMWERGIPEGTTYSSVFANPESDVNTDCMDKAYVTGNGGGGAGSDDVDGGFTILTSPNIDLTTYANPYIHFYRWFFNDGGSGTPNDSLVITLSNGTTTRIIDAADVNDPEVSTWGFKSIRVLNHMSLTNTMQFTVKAVDYDLGHLVEGGLDQFEIIDVPVGIEEKKSNAEVLVYPNPFNNELNIRLNKNYGTVTVKLFEITGQLLEERNFKNSLAIQITNNYKKGIYFMNVYGDGELIKTEKLIKI
ncbi:MAG: choice-of-anchor B family protein [Vicingus serpentipes]|nr:choice-of-anchor B family protein [Vicingus serpentipes]